MFSDRFLGAVFSRRRGGDKLAVWTGNAESKDACLDIGCVVPRRKTGGEAGRE